VADEASGVTALGWGSVRRWRRSFAREGSTGLTLT
jgi:hypothetical protein